MGKILPALLVATVASLAVPAGTSAQAAHEHDTLRLQASLVEPLPPPRTRGRERHWYGWQNLTVDTLAVTLILLPRFLPHDSGVGDLASGVGVAALGLASPIVHWAHGNIAEGIGSLVLRLVSAVFVLFGAMSAGLAEDDSRQRTSGTALMVFGLAALGGTIVLDAAVFSFTGGRPL